MSALLDELRAAGLVTRLPLDAAPIFAALATSAAGITPGTPFDVPVNAGPVTGLIQGVTVTGDASTAHLTVPLTAATLAVATPGGNVTLTAATAPALTLDLTAAGIRWAAPGPIALSASPATITVGTAAPLSMQLASATLTVTDGELELDIAGTIEVAGLPSIGALSTPFSVHADRDGFTGSATGHVGSATFTIGWSQTRDPLPSVVDITAPFSPPATGGISDAVVEVGDSNVRVRLTRTSAGYETTIAVESGDDGVLSSPDPRVAALAVLATATAGDTSAASGSSDAAEISPLIATAAVLGTAMGGTGRAQVSAMRFDTSTPDQVKIDYDAELSCVIDAGIVKASTPSPMRVAVRDATLSYGGATPTLSFVGASIDVSDTGRWEVTQPAGILQVAGMRSGHGSSFFELDLRLAFDLGPVKVTSAVLRVALDHTVAVSLQGFALSIDVPGLVEGEGRLSFDASGDFEAALRVSIEPLNLKASAGLVVEEATQGGARYRSILADLAVDLPAPLPLASTGLGLFGIQAIIGMNRSTKVEGELEKRLEWRPDKAHTEPALGSQLFGAGVAVGTLPDLGFAFSALGRVVVRSPDVAIIAAVDARLLSSPRSVTEAPTTSGTVSLLGLFVVDPAREIYAGVTGSIRFPAGGDWALLEVEVPVEARYPMAQPEAWELHIGTDGRRGGCGPIRAIVLPELFAIGAEAFLMLHGDGFDPVIDGLTQTPANGFSAAAGFSFSAVYGTPPVWADISIGAVVALGTRPLFVAGMAKAHGGLHLGPFSLALDATLELQLGPGSTKYAKLEACGSIDLWFFEISGCVTISFGGAQKPELEVPGNPLVSATVADRAGVATTGPNALTTSASGAPATWPDGTVMLGFAPGPKYVGAPSDPFHGDLQQTSSPKGAGTEAASDGTIGSKSYPATWTLTELTLDRVTNTTTTPVPGPLNARWQLPPALPAKTLTASRVLALFAKNAALWSLSLLDGGADDPADPVGVRERGCRQRWTPEAGWAVGGPATREGDGWDLPPIDDRPRPATISTVRAHVVTRIPAVDPLGHVPALPAYASLVAPGMSLMIGMPPFTELVPVDGYLAFPGALPLADVVVAIEREIDARAETTIVPDDALVPGSQAGFDPTIVLWSQTEIRDVEIWSPTQKLGALWDMVDHQTLERGGYVAVFVWREAEPVHLAVIRHPRRTYSRPKQGEDERRRHVPAIGIVAIGGVTSAAANAADDANDAGGAADADAHASATAPTPPSPFVEGATYRVGVTWKGTLENDPRTSGDAQHRYFSIATHASGPPPTEALYRSVSTFHPAMLGRYLAGYNVVGEHPWFVDDPIVVTFSSRTIEPVAAVYGYDLRLVVNRTDPPPGWADDGNPLLKQLFALTFVPSTQHKYLEAIDRLGIGRLEPDCPWPRDAADAEAHPELVPNASYEVGVLADPHDTDAIGNPTLPHRVATMLPRHSFHTSRWRSPDDLFHAFGFDQPTPQIRHIAVSSTIGTPPENSDGAMREALSDAGVALDALDVPARTTILWTPSGAGHTIGAVLLEAMEPVLRGSRLGEVTLAGFTTRTDSASTRVLFIATGAVNSGPLTMTWSERFNPFIASWTVTSSATLAVASSSAVPELAWEVWP